MQKLLGRASWCCLQGGHWSAWPGSAYHLPPGRRAWRLAAALLLGCRRGLSLTELMMDVLCVHFLSPVPLHLTRGSSLEECTARALTFAQDHLLAGLWMPRFKPLSEQTSPSLDCPSGPETLGRDLRARMAAHVCARTHSLFLAHEQGFCFPNQRLSSSCSKGKTPGWWKMELLVAHV